MEFQSHSDSGMGRGFRDGAGSVGSSAEDPGSILIPVVIVFSRKGDHPSQSNSRSDHSVTGWTSTTPQAPPMAGTTTHSRVRESGRKSSPPPDTHSEQCQSNTLFSALSCLPPVTSCTPSTCLSIGGSSTRDTHATRLGRCVLCVSRQARGSME